MITSRSDRKSRPGITLPRDRLRSSSSPGQRGYLREFLQRSADRDRVSVIKTGVRRSRTDTARTFGVRRPALSRNTESRRFPHHRRSDRNRTRIIYRERTEVVRNIDRHEYVYIDRHDRVHRHRARPGFRLFIRYGWGPYTSFGCVYPYYHRRYVFVSLGGWWPWHYRYVRYYWYGWHPYCWYGYYPVAREVVGDTYNYYTYNYYGDGGATTTAAAAEQPPLVDHTTFADVREKLAGEPAEPTLADKYFDDAVKAFEMGAYSLATDLFKKAMELAPEDVILPFAYCQSLFAEECYTKAAEALRAALEKVSPDKQGVFYPRGLYKDESVLMEQIDRLREKAELYSFDADLQLLLGYQLMGIGQLDEAVEPLRLAALDLENASAATVLLGVLEKLRTDDAEDTQPVWKKED